MHKLWLCSWIFGICTSAAWAAPIALIYRGDGSCPTESTTTGCSEAAYAMAVLAGFEPHYISADDAKNPLFKTAAVWIQPGGRARIQTQVMSAALKDSIKNFVRRGGGYVGFCAGGFLATEKFGWDTDKGPFEAEGLGFFAGKSFYYDLFDPQLNDKNLAKIVNTNWAGVGHSVYWELGPYFVPASVGTDGEIVAHYPTLGANSPDTSRIMTMRKKFGAGRVFVTAVHPEAPLDWRAYYKLQDADGLDSDLAVSMIRWAAGGEVRILNRR